MSTDKKSLPASIGVFTIVTTLACWTVIPPTLTWLVGYIDPWTANGWRYLISALIWLPVAIFGLIRGTLPKGVWKAALWPSFFNALGQICFGLAPYYIKPGLMTFSLRFQIVFLMTGAAIMFAAERRIVKNWIFLLGTAMVLGGTLLTIALNPSGLGEATTFGVILAVGSGFLYAAYALAVRKKMMGMNPLQAFAVVSQYTAIPLFVAMLILAKNKAGVHDMGMSLFDQSAKVIGVTLISAVIGIGIGHTLYYFSIARLGLVVSAGVVQLQPVTVSLVSIVMFNEVLTSLQWTTGLTAIAGAIVMLYAQHRLNKSDRAAEMVLPEIGVQD